MDQKLMLGTAQFGLEYGINNQNGKPTFKVINSILDYAFENGIRLLDTAEAYGDSHEQIGNYHRSSDIKFDLISKFSPNRLDLPANITDRVHHDLKILNHDVFYCYMFHTFIDFQNYFVSFKKELNELKKRGEINKIGVSLHSNANLEEVLNCDDIDLIQLPFNLLDNSSQRKAILQKAKSKNIEIHTRSAFLQGLFFKDRETLEGPLKIFKEDLIILDSIVKSEEMSSTALNYACQKDYIDRVIIGVENIEQLRSNLKSYSKEIPFETIDRIDSIIVNNPEMLNPVNWKK